MQAPRRSKREHHPTARLVAASAPPPAVSSGKARHARKRAPSPSPPPAEPPHRPRMRAAAHTTTSLVARVYLGEGKLLGRYTSRECALLCEVILAQLQTQALAPTALDAEQSPACIQWEAVAERMRVAHKLRVTPRECQQLWKFLAYGQVTGTQEELLPHSDEEDVRCSPAEINAKLAKKAAQPKDALKGRKQEKTAEEKVGLDKAGVQTGDKHAAKEAPGETEKKTEATQVKTAAGTDGKEHVTQPAEAKTAEEKVTELAESKTAEEKVTEPTESKTAEEKSPPKEPSESEAQPEEKKKTTAAEPAKSAQLEEKEATTAAAEPAKSEAVDETEPSGSTIQLYPTYTLPMGAPDSWHRPFNPKKSLPLTFVASRFLKRKPLPAQTQAAAAKATQHIVPGSTATGAVAVGVAVKPSTAEVKRKLAASAASAAEAKKRKIEIGTRTPSPSTFSASRVFTPSSTPPPPAKRPRTQLEFFEIRLRSEMEKAQDKTVLTAAEIQRRFGQASVQVRRECQELAVHDIDRYNRELVRVRIWEKAVGSKIVKPATTPSTQQAASTVSVAAPAASRRTGPTAALVAHAAAVSAAVNKPAAATKAATTQSTAQAAKTVAQPQAKPEQTVVAADKGKVGGHSATPATAEPTQAKPSVAAPPTASPQTAPTQATVASTTQPSKPAHK